jgi:hypothetical protein
MSKKIISLALTPPPSPKTPTKIPRPYQAQSPLSKDTKSQLQKALINHLSQLDAKTKVIKVIQNYYDQNEFSHFPKKLADQLKTLRDLENMATSDVPLLKQNSDTSVSTFFDQHLPKHFLSWLKEEGWSSKVLIDLSKALNLQIPKNTFIRVRIEKGKICWTLYDSSSKSWYSPSEKGQLDQILKPVAEPTQQDNTSYVDMTIKEFTEFKNAGKRHRPDKKSTISGQTTPIFTRTGRDKEARSIPPTLFDVDRYGLLSATKYKRLAQGLNMDHIPQDKWMLKAYYDYPDLERVVEILKTLLPNTTVLNPVDTFKKLAKDNDTLLTSDRMKEVFPILDTSEFKALLKHLTTFTRLSERTRLELQQKITTLHPKIKSLEISQETLDKVLKDYTETVKANGLAIAVTEEMHKSTRTFALKGRVTLDRLAQNNTVLAEALLDHRHYQTEVFPQVQEESFSQNLTAIGAFRFHYRSLIKAFNSTDQEILGSGYDAELMTHLQEWAKTK